MQQAYPKLPSSEIFSSFPENELNNLIEESIQRNLNQGEFLCHQDDIWPYVAHVSSGQLRWAMLATSGREHILFHINAGQNFWAHSIFDDQPMPAFLSATQKTTVLLWHRKTILSYLRRYPDVMWETTKILTRIMRQAREIIYSLAFQPVAGRLATLLLDHYKDSSGPQIERNFTLNELAARVAATPEVVCRLLYQFQEDGVLKITRASINIQDIDALEKAKKD